MADDSIDEAFAQLSLHEKPVCAVAEAVDRDKVNALRRDLFQAALSLAEPNLSSSHVSHYEAQTDIEGDTVMQNSITGMCTCFLICI